MATNGAIRHTVLFKVGKKEDLPYVVEEIKKFEEDIKHHVSILSYFVSTHTGGHESAQIMLIIDFLDVTNLNTFMEGSQHLEIRKKMEPYFTGLLWHDTPLTLFKQTM
ncbi:hypothetical protein CY35_05G067600 [Sphagnum magellanicum]|nr:hypothetical protein CY35_05G067600 [Sphagnum magellanicum]